MRRRLILIAAALSFASSAHAQPPRRDDRIFGIDKVKHFFIAGFVETLTFGALQAAGTERAPARTGSIALTATLSFGREIHDGRTKGLFSVRDLLWDALGATAGLLIINKTVR